MTIGERIKYRREELGLSQEDLATLLGYKSRSSINKIELGAQNLTQTKIKKIADALHTTPYYIMGWEKKEESDDDMYVIGKYIASDPKRVRECLELLMPLDDDKYKAFIQLVKTIK